MHCLLIVLYHSHPYIKKMHINQSSAVIVTRCLCDACGDLSQICASKLQNSCNLDVGFPLPVLFHLPAPSFEIRISNLRDYLSNYRILNVVC